MGSPVLLVHDDLVTIATVRRLITRDGLDLVLATTASDAVVAYGQDKPSLVLLASGVEEGRGAEALAELREYAEEELNLVILGEPIPGSDAPVVSLPLDGALFLQTVRTALRSSERTEPALTPVGREVEEITISMENALFGAPPALEALLGDAAPLVESEWEHDFEHDSSEHDSSEHDSNDEAQATHVALQEKRTDAMVTDALEQAQREIAADIESSLGLGEPRAPAQSFDETTIPEQVPQERLPETALPVTQLAGVSDDFDLSDFDDPQVSQEMAALRRKREAREQASATQHAVVRSDVARLEAAAELDALNRSETEEQVAREVASLRAEEALPTEDGAAIALEARRQREAEDTVVRELEAQREAARELEAQRQREAEDAAARELEAQRQREAEDAAARELEAQLQREA